MPIRLRLRLRGVILLAAAQPRASEPGDRAGRLRSAGLIQVWQTAHKAGSRVRSNRVQTFHQLAPDDKIPMPGAHGLGMSAKQDCFGCKLESVIF
jgi:hypothetical protein